jgi:hypothetical protein
MPTWLLVVIIVIAANLLVGGLMWLFGEDK